MYGTPDAVSAWSKLSLMSWTVLSANSRKGSGEVSPGHGVPLSLAT